MPYGGKPQCSSCQSTSSSLWRRTETGEIVCTPCFAATEECKNDQQNDKNLGVSSSGSSNSSTSNGVLTSSSLTTSTNNSNNSGENGNSNPPFIPAVVTRKSARTKPNKQSQTKANSTKGKGRRIIFKKSATKAPTAVATPITIPYTFYKGSYYQSGDIVSMVDVEGDVYYAQIRGLLQDQYCEKSAIVTWLLPTQSSPRDRFDPSTYIIGPDEDIPRKLECMEFVCHAPSEYFKARDSPYPTISQKPELCYVWSRLRPQIRQIKKTAEDIF